MYSGTSFSDSESKAQIYRKNNYTSRYHFSA